MRLHKISLEGVSGFGGSLPVFIVVMTKMAKIEGRPPLKVSASCDFFMNNLQDCKYIPLPPEDVWSVNIMCKIFTFCDYVRIRGVWVYGIGLKYMKNDTEFTFVPSLPASLHPSLHPPSSIHPSLALALPPPPSLSLFLPLPPSPSLACSVDV